MLLILPTTANTKPQSTTIMSVKIYAMYNNKGGVGKTTLGFNIATQFADENPSTQVLVIDLCPQANISQYLLVGGDNG